MGMKRRLISVAALLSFAVLFAPPGGAVCAWAGGGQHGCCAEPEVESATEETSCCGDSHPDLPSPTPPVDDGCDCLHAPEAPEAAAVGTPTSLESAPMSSPRAEESRVGGDLQQIHRTDDARCRGDGHDPPIFLTHCTFLI